MENYNEFLSRISYQQAVLQIRDGNFIPNERVLQKVTPDNSLKPFYGDTVVFDLPKKVKKAISPIIDALYDKCPECFCQRLDEHTMHMTLHDLSASDNLSQIACDVFKNEVKLLEVIAKNSVERHKIKMKTNFIVNMVDTSLVLTLVPIDEYEWNKLQKLYDMINEVRVCGYLFLTPHITLAYFNYNGFDKASSDKLKEVVTSLNEKLDIEIHLDTKKLYYQKFVSMNEYINIFGLAE